MSKYLISYDKYQNDWYPGELYHRFALELQATYPNDVEIINIKDLAHQYNEPFGSYYTGIPSIFNIFNLIVLNKNTGISFFHSLGDHAPAMLEHSSAIDKLNIKVASFSSNLTKQIINQYQNTIKIIPSFYILENFSDYELIINHCINKNYDKCYFNGLCYGHRKNIIDYLNNNPFFTVKNKTVDYLNKKQYYKELNQYKYGLSLNGAAQICYRDLEYFATKTLCLREPLNILTYDPIISDVHYKTILDHNTVIDIINNSHDSNIYQNIINKISNISIEEYEYITQNAYNWFINNAIPDKQISFLNQILKEHNILY